MFVTCHCGTSLACFQAHRPTPTSSSPPASKSSFVTCHVSKLTNPLLPLPPIQEVSADASAQSSLGNPSPREPARDPQPYPSKPAPVGMGTGTGWAKKPQGGLCYSLLYTGDYSHEEDRHLIKAEIPPVHPDMLLVESTY